MSRTAWLERARFVDHAAMIKERAPTTLSRRESLPAFAVALAAGCAPRSENGFVPKDWEPRSSTRTRSTPT
ncbi:MAG: hypothetical protein U0235_09810 [Polyangiaceae bacterium]